METELEDEEKNEEEECRTLVVRAKDGDWIMGDDLVLPVTGDETVVEIQEVIKSIKGVPITRMVVYKAEDNTRISDKHMTWSLSRNGLYAGDVIMVQPTRPNQWLWHSIEWYEDRLLNDVESFVTSSPWAERGKGCPLAALERDIPVPPPLRRDSLRSFLRRYPDHIRLDLDLVSEKFTAFVNKHEMLPPLSY